MFTMQSFCRRLARAAATLGLAWTVLNAGAHDLRHGRMPPADVGGELNLVDQHGAKFALSRLAGEPVLLFFGFTHCGSTWATPARCCTRWVPPRPRRWCS